MPTNRWTANLDRLPEDKRLRILAVAKQTFARDGFAGTNVNLLAEAAGISVGSLYKYFRTKEDLFLAVIDQLHEFLESTLDDLFAAHTTFFGRVEAILRTAAATSKADPDLVRLYIACTTQELGPLASRLSVSVEAVAVERYRVLVAEGKASGEVTAEANEAQTAFFLDNLFLLVQFSYGSVYYQERLQQFLGNAALTDPEVVVQALLGQIRRALARTK